MTTISRSVPIGGHGVLSGLNPTTLTMFEVTGHFNAVADPSISGNQNIPIVQAVNALATFSPRLLRGEQLFVSNYLVQAAYNAEQTVNLIGNPNGGTFTLSFGGYTTDPINFDATTSDVQTALRALPSIGSGNVNVALDAAPQAYDVQFTGTLGLQQMPAIVGDASLLTNPQGVGHCAITVTVTALGSIQITADTSISLPPLTARIFNGVLSTIDYVDTPGFQLTANSPQLNLNRDLIYDVSFTNATYNGASQFMAPFAFRAPTDDEPICLSSPLLERLPYQPPINTAWVPTQQSQPLMLVGGGGWRQRALNRGA